MRRVIPMARALLEQGESLWKQDRYEEAKQRLKLLLSMRQLPVEVAERAQFILGDIHLGEGQYRKARRHLAAAIATGTGSGETHFLMACALDWDDRPDPVRAYEHYRKAVELEPGQPLYSSAYALVRIRRQGSKAARDREALRRLRDAYLAATDDQDVAYNYIYGLIELGRYREAELPLLRARRQWPGQPAFVELWCRLQERRGRVADRLTRAAGSRSTQRRPECEASVIPFPRPDRPAGRPARLRPNSRLKTALASLSDRDVAAVARRLGLNTAGEPEALRAELERLLRRPGTLRALLAQLSGPGLQAMRSLSSAGGRLEVRQLRLRIDTAAQHAPHWFHHRSPLAELEKTGLVYLAADAKSPQARRVVIIPSDVRRLVREVVEQL